MSISFRSLRDALERHARREAMRANQAAPSNSPLTSDLPVSSDAPVSSKATSAGNRPGPERHLADSQPDGDTVRAASATLVRYGVRLIQINAEMHVGIWSWLDCSALRQALKVMGNDTAPVVYLDDFSLDLPLRFKLSTCACELDSEPLPTSVIKAMKQAAAAPWLVRDQLLEEIGWRYWTIGRPGARTFDETHAADRAVDRVVDRAVDRAADVPVVGADHVPDEGAAEPAATSAGSQLIAGATKGHDLGALSAAEIRWRRDTAARVFERARQEGPAASIVLAERERQEHERFEREQEQIRTGWNKWLAWRSKQSEAADAWRAARQAADGDDQAWLLEMGAAHARKSSKPEKSKGEKPRENTA